MLNDRIKKVRKALDLTQQEFAERIGMKRNSIAAIEIGHNTSDRTIIAICREFNVEETWLRTGEGEMFCALVNSPLGTFTQEYNLPDFISLTGKDIANSKIGTILRRLRMENGYTQQDVANILGIKNKSTLGSWEIGKSEPDIFTFLRLCLIYHVSDIYKTFLDESVKEDVFALSGVEQQVILAYRHSDHITKELVHRALSIDISQTDLELKARQAEKSPASGDIGAGEGRKGA